jgi:hypothetical protein
VTDGGPPRIRRQCHLITTIYLLNYSVVKQDGCSNVSSRQVTFLGDTMELFVAFEGAVVSTTQIVKATPGQMDAPTPCAEWDVRALLNHVIGTPLGDMPGPGLAGFTTLDVLVHGWDPARATRQPADLDGRLAAHALGFAGQALATPESRAGRIGPALAVPADATVTSQLVAFLGRQP